MSRTAVARIAGLLYVLNIALGIVGLMWQREGRAGADAMIIAGALEYAVIVVLLGWLLEPAGRALSWAVAAVGLAACLASVLLTLHLIALPANPIYVFGPYCIGLGALVVRSRMIPALLGWLLVLGGCSWLTFLLPDLSHRIAPWNTAAGILPELLFTLWLLAFAVREPPAR